MPTNMDWLKETATPEDFGRLLCDLMEYATDGECKECPFSKFCSVGHVGTTEWLNKSLNSKGPSKDFTDLWIQMQEGER